MFENLRLAGASVLDAMCGGGQTTEYLLSKGATVTGLDISSEIVNTFQARCPNAKILRSSLLNSGLPTARFDCISIVGGLHHVHPHVHEAVTEIHRLLKPGGYFCFMEPHSGSFPDLIRQFWYKHDRFFSDNEAAIDVKRMENDFATQFTVRKTRYLGNLAFLFVLNSLIFRIPVRLKRYYAPLLMPLESLLMKLQTKATSCFVVAQWQKR
jgi:SAM-dependent methyltransferase